MVRTITQIAGDFGLTQNAQQDPLAAVEASVLENVKKTIGEMRSSQEEINAAKGVSRSTFTEQAQMKQEGDIISNVAASLASVRAQDVLAQNQFQRNLLQTGVQADITSEQAKQNLGLQQQLIGTQTAATKELSADQTKQQKDLLATQAQLNEEAKTADVARQKEIIAAQADVSKQLQELQAGTQIKLQELSGQQQIGAIRETAVQNLGVMQAQTLEQMKLIDKTQAADLQKLSAQTQSQLTLIDEQFNKGEISADAALKRQLSLTNDSLNNQIAFLKQQTIEGKITQENALAAQMKLTEQTFNNDMAKVQELAKQNKISAQDAYQYQVGYTDANGVKQQGLIEKQYNSQIELAKTQGDIEMKKYFTGPGTGAKFDANGKYIPGTGGYLAEQGYQNIQYQLATLQAQKDVAMATSTAQFNNALLTKGMDYLLGSNGSPGLITSGGNVTGGLTGGGIGSAIGGAIGGQTGSLIGGLIGGAVGGTQTSQSVGNVYTTTGGFNENQNISLDEKATVA